MNLILWPFQAYSAVFRARESVKLIQENDPLAVIAEEAPRFSDAEAIAVLKERYGFDATVGTLVSERDQNFRVRTASGEQYVLKIANAAEASEVTDFQVQALLHIAAVVAREKIPIDSPEVILTVDGESQIKLNSTTGQHVARVVTFVKGIPMAERVASPQLARNMGAYLAHLGVALRDFSHPGSQQSLLWDLQQALNLRGLVKYVNGDDVAQAVTDTLDEFESHAAPALGSLRAQVIHSDFNPDNVLIDAEDPDRVAGVIDFGDMLYAPLVVDVAIGASYLRAPDGDPLRLIAEFIAGYHSVQPLEHAETDILRELIQARLCTSIAILDWRAAMRGADDPYLEKQVEGEASAGNFLCRMREIPRDSARQLFRQICASVDESSHDRKG